jgi:Protein of unknown function (DUF1573)/Peptidase C39 family
VKAIVLAGTMLLASCTSWVAYQWLSESSRLRSAEEGAKREDHVKRELSCGPRSLWTAGRRLGNPLGWSRVAEYFRDDASQGTTLLELEVGARALGLRASTRRLGWEELKHHDGVAVVFVNQRHFLAVDPREKAPTEMATTESVRVYDPDRVATWLSRPELDSIWEGECLLLMKPEGASRRGPVASLESCYEDSGLVKGRMSAEFRFPIRNVGTEPLSLAVINASCACTSVRLSSTLVLPGAEAYVDAVVNLENKQGKFGEAVTVKTNDPKCGAITFALAGAAPREVLLSTRRAYLSRLSPGSSADYTVAVYDPGEGRLEVKNVGVRLSKKIPESQSQPACEAKLWTFDAVDEQLRKRMNLSPKDMVLEFRVSAPADSAGSLRV